MKVLAKHDRRTLSAMCAELIEIAMRAIPKYRAMYEEAVLAEGGIPEADDTLRPLRSRAKAAASFTEAERRAAMDVLDMNITSDKDADLLKKEAEVVTGLGLDKLTPQRLDQIKDLMGALERLKA